MNFSINRICLITLTSIALSACGNGVVDGVKNGTLDFNKSTTVGKALDNWSSCESKDWKLVENPNGSKVVQFICKHKGVKEYGQMMKESIAQYQPNEMDAFNGDVRGAVKLLLAKYPESLSVGGYTDTFSFNVNTDKTFKLSEVNGELVWLDGTKSSVKYDQPVSYLQDIYKNRLSWDPKTIQPMIIIGMASTNSNWTGEMNPTMLGLIANHIQYLYLTAKGIDYKQTLLQTLSENKQ